MVLRERAQMLHAEGRKFHEKKEDEKQKTENQSAHRTTRIPRGSPIVSLLLLLLFWVVKNSSKL